MVDFATEQTAEAEFCRGSASDLLSVGRGSVIILVANPRLSIGKFPINLTFSNMYRSASRSCESETDSHRSAAVCLMAVYYFVCDLYATAYKFPGKTMRTMQNTRRGNFVLDFSFFPSPDSTYAALIILPLVSWSKHVVRVDISP